MFGSNQLTSLKISDSILKKITLNKEALNLSLVKLHPAIKYYALSKINTLLRHKYLTSSFVINQLYSKNLTKKSMNFSTKLTSTFSQSPFPQGSITQKPFLHRFFTPYKLFFIENKLPLVGSIPSYYLSDIKPLKTWKFLNIFLKSEDTNHAGVRVKPRILKLRPSDFKQTVCKKVRLRLIRSFLNQNVKTPITAQGILNFKTASKRFANFKPLLKRSLAPVYVSKWKTSYPLMFTNNAYSNKLIKPQFDLTVKTFIQSRNNRRVRRFKKMLFRKLKRSSRDKRSLKRTPSIHQKQKQSILTCFFNNRLRSRKSSIVANTQRLVSGPAQLQNLKKLNKRSDVLSNKRQVQSKIDKNYSVSWNKLYSHNRGNNHIANTVTRVSQQIKPLQVKNLVANVLSRLRSQIGQSSHLLLPTRQLVKPTAKKDAYPYLRPRTDKNFIFKNFGMFLTAFTLFNQKNPFTYKYMFKKKIFSFLYPNEVRNALMARKKRIVFYQLIYKTKHKSKQRLQYSFASFNKFFINHYKTSLQNTANGSLTQKLFDKLNTPLSSTLNTSSLPNYVSSRDEILYDQNFSYRGVDLSFKRSEVKIPRVRFRPGYQRMWRNARNALKESMGLKFVYQQQLTRCLVRFYKNSNKYSFARSEMSANRIIMYSRLLPDNPTVNIFIDQKLIYINGKLLHTQQMILVPNDLIQLVVSLWYYVAYRWISNWTLKRHKKFKKLVYRKGLAGKHKVMKLKKQRSYYTPNWIYLARYDISDIKPFLEVDYFTLSAFVLYEPFTTYYYTPDESPDFRPNIYRMYNWKYIT